MVRYTDMRYSKDHLQIPVWSAAALQRILLHHDIVNPTREYDL